MEIQKTKAVWVAWTNTDLTEGRGRDVPKAVCEAEATALRVGKKGYVQGSDCPVTESTAIMVNNCWLVPGRILPLGEGDVARQKQIDSKRAAIEKARAVGLTEEDINLLAR